MGSITFALDKALLQQARIKALQEGTTVSAVIRDFIVSYAQGADTPEPAIQSQKGTTHSAIATEDAP